MRSSDWNAARAWQTALKRGQGRSKRGSRIARIDRWALEISDRRDRFETVGREGVERTWHQRLMILYFLPYA